MICAAQATMVSIHPRHRSDFLVEKKKQLTVAALCILVIFLCIFEFNSSDQEYEAQIRRERINRPKRPSMIALTEIMDEDRLMVKVPPRPKSMCRYQSLDDLQDNELQPQAGERHMKTPPIGGKLSLVCCATTAGPLAIVAHHKWAPRGTERFLEMVRSGYFDSGVPFMRCVEDFLCQFGLNSDRSKTANFEKTIKDDPSWLHDFQENSSGVKRFAEGYLAYAGAGPDTRGNEFIVALKSSGKLGGKSPWEVPWGELVGQESFVTLHKIHTDYGEDGPSQKRLQKEGMTDEMREEFSKLDFINSCQILDEGILEDPLFEPGLD